MDYVKIGNHTFPTLLAISADEQSRGLMGVKEPVPVMSFVYAAPCLNKFWMSETLAPLDIVFACNGVVNSICVGVPYSNAIIGNDELSDLVIELPAGTCNAYNIGRGSSIEMAYCQDTAMKVLMLKSGIRF